MLAAGELGDIVGVSTSIRLWRPQSYYDQPGRGTRARDGGGVLLTQGIHTLDLMLSLAGPVAEVTGYATTTPIHRMETEDMVAAAARFANGAIGVIDATTSAYPGFPERIELACKNATAAIAGTALEVRFHDGRIVRHEADGSGGGTGADPMAFPHDYHRALIGDFLDAIAHVREPAVSGAEALEVHNLIDALLETARTGRPVAVLRG
jgi:predicted dehydrogenase